MKTFAWAIITIVAAAVLWAGVHWGTFSAADSDPYGYVSQADLMAHGSLHVDQRFASTMPWPHPTDTFTPPGWHPTPDGFLVPSYSPGLPLVMAAFQRVKGRDAVFYVVPVLGALAVFMTGLLGLKVHGPLTGASAAMLLGTSPIFVYQLVQPVSDVAAASWWTVSVALAVIGGPIGALICGLAASMAILTRPNIAPLAAVIALFVGWHDRRQFVLFALGVAPGCIGVAVINDRLFGSPLLSGYGHLSDLYSWSNFTTNLRLYPRWIVEARSLVIFLALGTPWFARSVRADRVWFMLTFSGAVFVLYVFSAPWGPDQWNFLRFLLPAFPPLTVLSVIVATCLLQRVFPRTSPAAAFVVFCVLAVWQAHETTALGVLYAKTAEQRYVDVGKYVAAIMPNNAIYFAGTQAGSLRYYSNHLTVRLDQLEPEWLDRAVETLRERGYRPYFVLEEAEEPWFREKYSRDNILGQLDWPATAERSDATVVRIYDPLDRDHFLTGDFIPTWDVHRVNKPKVSHK